jgi:RHS repeat-associated protein
LLNIPGTSDTQTCNYTHVDLGRIAGANCGAALNQTFSLDAFGNLKTTGTPTGLVFDPNSFSNNRISGAGYDNNGNLLDDPVTPATSVNAFDAEGRPVKLENIAVTFDALGRAVEAAKSGGTVEFLYGPSGGKLEVMSGQSLVGADIPLPGGGAAVYSATGLAFYRHADQLGSSRLASTPARTLYSATAYAAFGAAYNESGTHDRSFTGQTQDAGGTFSGGQYDFLVREYNSIQGRWWSPDPAGLAVVDPNSPESWNRYAYVGGMPLEIADPTDNDGEWPTDIHKLWSRMRPFGF